MKVFCSRISIFLISLFTLVSLSSCEEDWWYDDDYWEDRWETTSPYIEGEWRVDDIHGYSSNYRPGDLWTFDWRGRFFTDGYNLKEEGNWRFNGRSIQVSFRGSSFIDLDAYIRTLKRDYMVLDVKDFESNERYTVRLVKEVDYSQHKDKPANFTEAVRPDTEKN